MPLDRETVDAIRQVVREEISGAKPQKSRRNHDKRVFLQLGMYRDEMAALDAVCAARGCCRSDLLRELLQPVLNRVLAVNRQIPENFRRNHNRRKAAHHRDGATDDRARETATARLKVIGYERSAILADLAAAAARPLDPAMLSDAAGASVAPKLPRSR